MIDKEGFKNLVYSSIRYTGDWIPYLVIDDTNMVCPFCTKELKNKKGEIKCGCNDSTVFSAKMEEYNKQISELQKKVEDNQKFIYDRALNFYQQYFMQTIVPQMNDEYNKNIKEIMDLTSEE